MVRTSAGILLYRFHAKQLQVMLVHMGGPFWARKDAGAWTIPKGEYETGEDPLDAAKREFSEETGHTVEGQFIALAPIKQKSGKVVQAWAVEGDFDVATLKSNMFTTEWPPKSGKMQSFPEVDKAEWFTLDIAREKMVQAQAGLLDELEQITGK